MDLDRTIYIQIVHYNIFCKWPTGAIQDEQKKPVGCGIDAVNWNKEI